MDVGLSTIFCSFRIWSIEICWLFRSSYVRCEQSQLCQWKNQVISTINGDCEWSCFSDGYFLVSPSLHNRFDRCVFGKNRLLKTMQIGRKNHDIPMPIIQLFFALSLLVNFGLVLVDRILFLSQFFRKIISQSRFFPSLLFLQIFIFSTMDFY